MKCHLLIKMFLRLGKEGPYAVTNGKILLRVFCLFCRADILSLNLISESVF